MLMTDKKTENKEVSAQELSATLEEATLQLIQDHKLTGQIKYADLAELIAIPYELDTEGIDRLIQKVEDNGIAIVGEDGGPTKQQLV